MCQRLAREVLAPLLEVGSESVLYQAVPVLRVSHPSTKCMGKMHTDYVSNNHQPAELNFWIPLCRAFGNNTLYVESAPGVGDFVPIELSHGQGMRFWFTMNNRRIPKLRINETMIKDVHYEVYKSKTGGTGSMKGCVVVSIDFSPPGGLTDEEIKRIVDFVVQDATNDYYAIGLETTKRVIRDNELRNTVGKVSSSSVIRSIINANASDKSWGCRPESQMP